MYVVKPGGFCDFQGICKHNCITQLHKKKHTSHSNEKSLTIIKGEDFSSPFLIILISFFFFSDFSTFHRKNSRRTDKTMMVQTRFDQYSCVCLFFFVLFFLSFFLSFLFIYSLGFTDKRFDVIWHPVLFQTNTFVVSDIGTSTRFRILLLLFSLAQGSSSLPPTTATQVQSRTCTWAEIG